MVVQGSPKEGLHWEVSSREERRAGVFQLKISLVYIPAELYRQDSQHLWSTVDFASLETCRKIPADSIPFCTRPKTTENKLQIRENSGEGQNWTVDKGVSTSISKQYVKQVIQSL